MVTFFLLVLLYFTVGAFLSGIVTTIFNDETLDEMSAVITFMWPILAVIALVYGLGLLPWYLGKWVAGGVKNIIARRKMPKTVQQSKELELRVIDCEALKRERDIETIETEAMMEVEEMLVRKL